MEQELLEKLIDFLEKATPALWGAAMSRALAQALLTGIVAAIFLTAAVIFFVLCRTYYKRYVANKRDDDWYSATALGVLGLLTALIGSVFFHDVVMYIAAPELNAIGVLFSLVQ